MFRLSLFKKFINKKIFKQLINCLEKTKMIKGNPKCLTMDNLNPAVKNVQYAVRGRVVIRANELEKEMKQGQVKKLHSFIMHQDYKV